MHTITNGLITVKAINKGAELQSIYCHKTNLEYLWSGDEQYWAKKSPVLFPIVGGLKHNTYKHEGKSYKLPRHGFARDTDFELAEQTATTLTFTLTSNEQTKAVYPFDFSFSIHYALEGNGLHITFQVNNTGTTDQYFSVGAHPAFAVPLVSNLKYEDYYLLFNEFEVAGRWPLAKDGSIENFAVPFLDNINHVHLSKELFAHDAIVLKNLRSTSITIKSEKLPHGVKLTFRGFPYMGLWAAKGADFVCIEPWCGIADSVDATGELKDKEGITRQAPGATFSRTYSIDVF
jgi:galactose mutarotase-like enzyme